MDPVICSPEMKKSRTVKQEKYKPATFAYVHHYKISKTLKWHFKHFMQQDNVKPIKEKHGYFKPSESAIIMLTIIIQRILNIL